MTGSFSYSGAPSTNDPMSLVRLAIGDTNPDDVIFTDEEIAVVLELQPVVTYAAAALAEMAAAKFARLVSISIGSTSISAENKYQQYKELAARLRKQGGSLPGGDGTGIATQSMTVQGISQDVRSSFREDDDAIQPSFSIGQDDHPGTPDTGSDRWK